VLPDKKHTAPEFSAAPEFSPPEFSKLHPNFPRTSTTSPASSPSSTTAPSTSTRSPVSCIEISPFGGIKDSGNGYKEGVIEAMKSFTNVKTFSMPWR